MKAKNSINKYIGAFMVTALASIIAIVFVRPRLVDIVPKRIAIIIYAVVGYAALVVALIMFFILK